MAGKAARRPNIAAVLESIECSWADLLQADEIISLDLLLPSGPRGSLDGAVSSPALSLTAVRIVQKVREQSRLLNLPAAALVKTLQSKFRDFARARELAALRLVVSCWNVWKRRLRAQKRQKTPLYATMEMEGSRLSQQMQSICRQIDDIYRSSLSQQLEMGPGSDYPPSARDPAAAASLLRMEDLFTQSSRSIVAPLEPAAAAAVLLPDKMQRSSAADAPLQTIAASPHLSPPPPPRRRPPPSAAAAATSVLPLSSSPGTTDAIQSPAGPSIEPPDRMHASAAKAAPPLAVRASFPEHLPRTLPSLHPSTPNIVAPASHRDNGPSAMSQTEPAVPVERELPSRLLLPPVPSRPSSAKHISASASAVEEPPLSAGATRGALLSSSSSSVHPREQPEEIVPIAGIPETLSNTAAAARTDSNGMEDRGVRPRDSSTTGSGSSSRNVGEERHAVAHRKSHKQQQERTHDANAGPMDTQSHQQQPSRVSSFYEREAKIAAAVSGAATPGRAETAVPSDPKTPAMVKTTEQESAAVAAVPVPSAVLPDTREKDGSAISTLVSHNNSSSSSPDGKAGDVGLVGAPAAVGSVPNGDRRNPGNNGGGNKRSAAGNVPPESTDTVAAASRQREATAETTRPISVGAVDLPAATLSANCNGSVGICGIADGSRLNVVAAAVAQTVASGTADCLVESVQVAATRSSVSSLPSLSSSRTGSICGIPAVHKDTSNVPPGAIVGETAVHRIAVDDAGGRMAGEREDGAHSGSSSNNNNDNNKIEVTTLDMSSSSVGSGIGNVQNTSSTTSNNLPMAAARTSSNAPWQSVATQHATHSPLLVAATAMMTAEVGDLQDDGVSQARSSSSFFSVSPPSVPDPIHAVQQQQQQQHDPGNSAFAGQQHPPVGLGGAQPVLVADNTTAFQPSKTWRVPVVDAEVSSSLSLFHLSPDPDPQTVPAIVQDCNAARRQPTHAAHPAYAPAVAASVARAAARTSVAGSEADAKRVSIGADPTDRSRQGADLPAVLVSLQPADSSAARSLFQGPDATLQTAGGVAGKTAQLSREASIARLVAPEKPSPAAALPKDRSLFDAFAKSRSSVSSSSFSSLATLLPAASRGSSSSSSDNLPLLLQSRLKTVPDGSDHDDGQMWAVEPAVAMSDPPANGFAPRQSGDSVDRRMVRNEPAVATSNRGSSSGSHSSMTAAETKRPLPTSSWWSSSCGDANASNLPLDATQPRRTAAVASAIVPTAAAVVSGAPIAATDCRRQLRLCFWVFVLATRQRQRLRGVWRRWYLLAICLVRMRESWRIRNERRMFGTMCSAARTKRLLRTHQAQMLARTLASVFGSWRRMSLFLLLTRHREDALLRQMLLEWKARQVETHIKREQETVLRRIVRKWARHVVQSRELISMYLALRLRRRFFDRWRHLRRLSGFSRQIQTLCRRRIPLSGVWFFWRRCFLLSLRLRLVGCTLLLQGMLRRWHALFLLSIRLRAAATRSLLATHFRKWTATRIFLRMAQFGDDYFQTVLAQRMLGRWKFAWNLQRNYIQPAAARRLVESTEQCLARWRLFAIRRRRDLRGFQKQFAFRFLRRVFGRWCRQTGLRVIVLVRLRQLVAIRRWKQQLLLAQQWRCWRLISLARRFRTWWSLSRVRTVHETPQRLLLLRCLRLLHRHAQREVLVRMFRRAYLLRRFFVFGWRAQGKFQRLQSVHFRGLMRRCVHAWRLGLMLKAHWRVSLTVRAFAGWRRYCARLRAFARTLQKELILRRFLILRWAANVVHVHQQKRKMFAHWRQGIALVRRDRLVVQRAFLALQVIVKTLRRQAAQRVRRFLLWKTFHHVWCRQFARSVLQRHLARLLRKRFLSHVMRQWLACTVILQRQRMGSLGAALRRMCAVFQQNLLFRKFQELQLLRASLVRLRRQMGNIQLQQRLTQMQHFRSWKRRHSLVLSARQLQQLRRRKYLRRWAHLAAVSHWAGRCLHPPLLVRRFFSLWMLAGRWLHLRRVSVLRRQFLRWMRLARRRRTSAIDLHRRAVDLHVRLRWTWKWWIWRGLQRLRMRMRYFLFWKRHAEERARLCRSSLVRWRRQTAVQRCAVLLCRKWAVHAAFWEMRRVHALRQHFLRAVVLRWLLRRWLRLFHVQYFRRVARLRRLQGVMAALRSYALRRQLERLQIGRFSQTSVLCTFLARWKCQQVRSRRQRNLLRTIFFAWRQRKHRMAALRRRTLRHSLSAWQRRFRLHRLVDVLSAAADRRPALALAFWTMRCLSTLNAAHRARLRRRCFRAWKISFLQHSMVHRRLLHGSFSSWKNAVHRLCLLHRLHLLQRFSFLRWKRLASRCLECRRRAFFLWRRRAALARLRRVFLSRFFVGVVVVASAFRRWRALRLVLHRQRRRMLRGSLRCWLLQVLVRRKLHRWLLSRAVLLQMHRLAAVAAFRRRQLLLRSVRGLQRYVDRLATWKKDVMQPLALRWAWRLVRNTFVAVRQCRCLLGRRGLRILLRESRLHRLARRQLARRALRVWRRYIVLRMLPAAQAVAAAHATSCLHLALRRWQMARKFRMASRRLLVLRTFRQWVAARHLRRRQRHVLRLVLARWADVRRVGLLRRALAQTMRQSLLRFALRTVWHYRFRLERVFGAWLALQIRRRQLLLEPALRWWQRLADRSIRLREDVCPVMVRALLGSRRCRLCLSAWRAAAAIRQLSRDRHLARFWTQWRTLRRLKYVHGVALAADRRRLLSAAFSLLLRRLEYERRLEACLVRPLERIRSILDMAHMFGGWRCLVCAALHRRRTVERQVLHALSVARFGRRVDAVRRRAVLSACMHLWDGWLESRLAARASRQHEWNRRRLRRCLTVLHDDVLSCRFYRQRCQAALLAGRFRLWKWTAAAAVQARRTEFLRMSAKFYHWKRAVAVRRREMDALATWLLSEIRLRSVRTAFVCWRWWFSVLRSRNQIQGKARSNALRRGFRQWMHRCASIRQQQQQHQQHQQYQTRRRW